MNVREKLVELLAEYFTIGDSYAYNLTRTKEAFAVGTVSIDDFEEFDDEVVADIADHLITHGVTVQEWISVSERLPEDEGKFLVCGNRGGIYTAEFRKFGGVYPHWHKLNSKSHYCAPTHWMPLPPTPKEE